MKKKAFKKQCNNVIEINNFCRDFLLQEREFAKEEKNESYDYILKHLDNISFIFRKMSDGL